MISLLPPIEWPSGLMGWDIVAVGVGVLVTTASYLTMLSRRKESSWSSHAVYAMTATQILLLISGVVAAGFMVLMYQDWYDAEYMFHGLWYLQTVLWTTNGFTGYIVIMLTVIYLQVFRGVLLSRAFTRLYVVVTSVSVCVVLASLCVYAWDWVVCMGYHSKGVDAFVTEWAEDYFHHFIQVEKCYMVLQLVALLQMSVLMVWLRVRAGSVEGDVNHMASLAADTDSDTPTQPPSLSTRVKGRMVMYAQRRARLRKIDVAPWLFIFYIAASLTMEIAAWEASAGDDPTYTRILLIVCSIIESVTVSVLFYPFGSESARDIRRKSRQREGGSRWTVGV
ncbi:hypothetical protein KIPB_010809 [Kipferlia bialata]|uniref:Uncharacterized protein n=1 Tax=Kipferlia bialata TaxID=797122 RepID=A0A9K3D7C3_9EUKA|nr:hypothetical protein KIPB_010809 [Kipferlia bialata]|eukprot:g10809.t1